MSNLLHPVGPLPPKVYWVRRLLVLAVAILVVVITATIVVKIIGGSSSDSDKSNAGSKSTESKNAPAGSPLNCTGDDIALTLGANSSAFAEGQNPTFSVEVSNVGADSCLVDANEETLSVEIVSGKDQIWSSGFCTEAEQELLLLGPEDVHAVAKNWDRVRNDKKCSKDPADAKPGTYRATANLLGAKSKELVFTLN